MIKILKITIANLLIRHTIEQKPKATNKYNFQNGNQRLPHNKLLISLWNSPWFDIPIFLIKNCEMILTYLSTLQSYLPLGKLIL